MRTELPAERLHRRLGGESDDDDADDDRPDTSLSRWLPESGANTGWVATVRADPGRAGVVALAVVGVIAVLVTVFTLVRDEPPPVTSAKLPPVQMVSSASPTPAAAPPAGPDGPVVVSVVGLVHKPGLVTLTAGARIADALTAAGGALDGADLIGLNMARRVADGEQIVVGIAAPPGEQTAMGSSTTSSTAAAPGAPSGTGSASAPTGSVDLNTATVEELDTLPGVGPVTAAAIVAWRDANGRFTSIDQLGEVDGIGPARLEKLRGLVHV
ncbi:ComEA family DNA-binding protein [Mycobacterium hubeiense]|uniref:ComEA family DNA-binding protein n=1 Tax=Mycobacterium hubeiense TaxID=1867256 RepID=UPI000C7EBFB9|nr:ComEA family DNA-binding protein [Mycobacterium sp. QGD 101]